VLNQTSATITSVSADGSDANGNAEQNPFVTFNPNGSCSGHTSCSGSVQYVAIGPSAPPYLLITVAFQYGTVAQGGSLPNQTLIGYNRYLLPGVLQEPDIQAENVEITQGIQQIVWDAPATVQAPTYGAVPGGTYSGVPLVRDVPTVVRAYASVANESGAKPQASVTADLHAYRGAPGALSELAGSPISATPRSLQVGAALPLAREQPLGAYTFTLPKSWTEQGPITLVADINPERGGVRPIQECAGCTANNAFALSQVGFTTTQPVTIRPFQIVYRYPNPGGHGFTTVNGPDLSSLYQRARDLLPLTQADLIVQPFPAAVLDLSAQVQHIVLKFRTVFHHPLTKPNLSDCYKIPECADGIVSAEFDAVRRTIALGHSGHTYLAGFDPSPAAGSTWPKQGFTVIGPDSPPRPLTDATHELLHLLLFDHASTACGGGTAGQVGVPWPPDQMGYIQGIGLDRRPNSGGAGAYKLVAPGLGQPQWYDLMSYCSRGNDAVAWISTINWTKLVRDDSAPGSAADSPAPLASSSAARVNLAVDASIAPGGQATVLGASSTTGAATSSQASQFHLEAIGAGGHVISNIGVLPQRITESPVMMLAANLPARGATAIKLTAGGHVVATLRKPSPSPSIRLVVPRGGFKAVRHKLTVRWRDKGARGVALTVALEYEVSRAQGWRTLAAGLTGQSYTVPLVMFNHATHVHVRVVVGDGFSDAVATSSLIRLQRR
jgi:hypothetical protein